MKSFHYSNPVSRFFIALCIAVILLFVTSDLKAELITKVMIFWDGFGFSYLVMSWLTFFFTDSDEIRKVATNQDKIHFVIFIVLLLATIFSVIAIILLLSHEKENLQLNITFIYISGAIISWILQHSIFAFHYAHMYYNVENSKVKENGLVFPHEKDPDYIDFAYFSFVIGMTFQVSDVSVNSRQIRRFVLLHSLLSFAFNTFILALVVNLVINFSQK